MKIFIKNIILLIYFFCLAFVFNNAQARDSRFEFLPQILSDNDINLYKQIFELQKKDKFKEADELIKKLNDKILLSYVLSMRYLQSSKYISSKQELKNWLDNYQEHPHAKKVYNLAKKKKASGIISPEHFGFPGSYENYGFLKAEDDASLITKKIFANFRSNLLKGRTKSARLILEDANTKNKLINKDYDKLAGYLGFSYFLDKEYGLAHKWATSSVNRTSTPIGLWASGLVSWQQKDYKNAGDYFAKLAKDKKSSSWLKSAGAFWAYRSYQKDKNYKKADEYLNLAAEYPYTFYGCVALKNIEGDLNFNWSKKIKFEVEKEDLAELKNYDIGKRAIALLEIGQYSYAEKEFQGLYLKLPIEMKYILLEAAESLELPYLSYKISEYLAHTEGYENLSGFYPLAHWQPKDGWQVDKALMLAFARQESGFNTEAMSRAGAKGLMQVMPRTAAYIAKNKSLRSKNGILFEPEYNLYLGQKYIMYLMSYPHIRNNLLYLAAAYNAGPGNLKKWQKRAQGIDDPFLFIETLPSRETRNYVKKVMANLWIYSSKLNRPMPSLDEIAIGKWPSYASIKNSIFAKK